MNRSEQILEILRKAGSDGERLPVIAKKLGVVVSTVKYYIDGKTVGDKILGGKLVGKVENVGDLEGRNRFVRLKK